jgi:hypothetical protein
VFTTHDDGVISAVMATFYHYQVITQTAVFLVMMLHNLVDAYHHTRGTSCLRPQCETKPCILFNPYFTYDIEHNTNFPFYF